MNSPPASRGMVKSGAAVLVANMDPKSGGASIPPTADGRWPPSRQSEFRHQSSESGPGSVGRTLGSQVTAGLWHERIPNSYRVAKEPGLAQPCGVPPCRTAGPRFLRPGAATGRSFGPSTSARMESPAGLFSAKPMNTFVVLLRGVMPYGRNRVSMADLRTVLSEAGLGDVQTYIQTGNVVAKSELSRTDVQTLVHEAIKENIGAQIPAIARTAEQFRVIFEQNPFASADSARVYFSLLQEYPSRANLEKFLLTDVSPDTVRIIDDTLYTRYNTKHSDSKFTNNFFERQLKVTATTRNFNTMSKLVELSSA